MKKILAILGVAVGLAGCAATPKIDWTKTDAACAQQCSSSYSSCVSGFKLFPVAAQMQCNDAIKVCSDSCPTAISQQMKTGSVHSTATQKLIELDSMYKNGLIDKAIFDSKKLDVLKEI